MIKPGKMHCVIRIKPTGDQLKMRRNLAHRGSWDTIPYYDMFGAETAFVIPQKGDPVSMLGWGKIKESRHVHCSVQQ